MCYLVYGTCDGRCSSKDNDKIKRIISIIKVLLYDAFLTFKMSNKNFENNNNTEAVNANPTNSLIYKFEHGERLKAEQEAKERKRALFAKKMAIFGEGEKDDLPKSTNAVNQKAKMFIEIANKDPEKERAERERKLEFEKKKLGFQEGTVPCNNNTKVRIRVHISYNCKFNIKYLY